MASIAVRLLPLLACLMAASCRRASPELDIPNLAFKRPSEVDAMFGTPDRIDPVLGPPENVPGENRRYPYKEGKYVTVRIFRGQVVEVGADPPTDFVDPFVALRAVGIETNHAQPAFRYLGELPWQGTIDGTKYKALAVYRLRVRKSSDPFDVIRAEFGAP